MITGYETNVAAHQPLMRFLDGVLLTVKEVGAHLRYSPEQLSNLRRGSKGPPWIKLPSGGVRYEAGALMEWQMSGTAGPLSMDRVTLAVLACDAVPIEHRAAIVAHLEVALPPMGKREAQPGRVRGPTNAVLEAAGVLRRVR